MPLVRPVESVLVVDAQPGFVDHRRSRGRPAPSLPAHARPTAQPVRCAVSPPGLGARRADGDDRRRPAVVGLITDEFGYGLIATLAALNVGIADPGGADRLRARALMAATIAEAVMLALGTLVGADW